MTRHSCSVVSVLLAAMLLSLDTTLTGQANTPIPTMTAQHAPPDFQGVVQTPDGKPVAGAMVTLDMVDRVAHLVTGSSKSLTGADGAFDLPWPQSSMSASKHPGDIIIYAVTATGVALANPMPGKKQTVVLQPFTQVRVRFVDAENKPIAHLQVEPLYFASQTTYGRWDMAISPQWTKTTDAQGYAVWTQLPQGLHMQPDVDDTHFAQLSYHDQVALANGPVTPSQTIHLQRSGTIMGYVRFGATGQPAPGVVIQATPGQDDDTNQVNSEPSGPDGRFQIARLPAGTYSLQIMHPWNDKSPWTAAAPMVTVTPGGEVIAPNIALVHGGLLTGTVTDQTTGKPLAGVNVWVNGPAEPSGFRNQDMAASGPDGSYTLRVAPGVQTVNFFSPGTNQGNQPQSVTVAEGQTQTLNLQAVAPVATLDIHGTVIGADGKPAGGAQVIAVAGNTADLDVVADATGQFELTGQQVLPGTLVFARLGGLATADGTPITTSMTTLTLTLAPNVLTTFRGRVADTDGKPLAHVKLNLYRGLPGNGGGIGDAVTTTDAQGRYAFPPDFAGARYSVDAEAAGYATKFSDNITAVAGKTMVVPPLLVSRADSFVGGTVVDPQGHPIAGADVSVMNISNLHMMTDTHGRFHLVGVPRKQVILEVTAPEGRWTSMQVASGRTDDVLKVESPAEQDAESKRFVAKLDADATNHGDGTDAHVLLRRAEMEAAATHRQVLLVFHASWCGPCFVLHRFLENPKVKPLMDSHFVVQDIDIWEKGAQKPWENPGGVDIYKQYHGPNSVPYFVVLSPTGTALGSSMHNGQNMGVPTQPDDVNFFFATLRRAAPSLTPADFATLRTGLTRSGQF